VDCSLFQNLLKGDAMVARENDTHFTFEQKVDELDFNFNIPKGSNWAQAKTACVAIHEELVRQEAQAVAAEAAKKAAEEATAPVEVESEVTDAVDVS
jgi:hypothetical protein